MTEETQQTSVADAVASNPHWYHTIELAPGVVTPGHVDMRASAARVLPDDLSGRRALDVGTFDGFWAFEMERRGADVVAIDVERIDAAEWPPINRTHLEARASELDLQLGRGFQVASRALGSTVRRVISDVYEVTPDVIGGPVDFAFCGALLLHLRDPVRALERIEGALVPGGALTICEPFSLAATIRSPRSPLAEFKPLVTDFNWWFPNLATLSAWPRAAGFARVSRQAVFRPKTTKELRAWHAAIVAVKGDT